MKHLFTAILLLFATISFAQKGSVKGIVYGKIDKEVVPYASVKLLLQKDSTFITGDATSLDGKFKIGANLGKYILEISFMGYETLYKDVEINKDLPHPDLDTLWLTTKTIELEGATIVAKIPDVQVKGDTIEFNAAGFKVDEGALLQDLLKKLPGIEVDSKGNISANGKPITKILVDGKEFFGNDIQVALENLPAEMIDELQLFKEQSEMSKLTGFKDGNEQQVINLKVKEEIKQSIIGNVEAGYGSNKRYNNSAFLNYMKGDNQFSLIGKMENTPYSANSMWMQRGLETNRNIGSRFNIENSEKFSVNGGLFFRNNIDEDNDQTLTQLFLTKDSTRISKSSSESYSKKNSLTADFSLSWKPDSLTNISFRGSYQNSDTRSSRKSENISYLQQDSLKKTSNESNGLNKSVDNNWTGWLSVGRKFSKEGRSLNMYLGTSLRTGKQDGKNWSETKYPDNTIPDRKLDQLIESTNNSASFNFTLAYVEPIGNKNYLQAKYSISNSKSERDRNTFRKDGAEQYSVIDTAYTRFTENKYWGQSLNLSFQSVREKYDYTIGIDVDPSSSKSNILFKDSLIESVKQSTVNFSPSIRFAYRPNDNTNLNIDYTGATTRPSLAQLSADTINTSASSKTIGNPNLKTTYNNQLNISYQQSNFERGDFLNASYNMSYTLNDIVDNMTIDSLSNSITTYHNVSGNMNASLYASYGSSILKKKVSYNIGINSAYYKRNGYLNGKQTATNNWSFGGNAYLSYSSDKVSASVNSSYSRSIVSNNQSEESSITSSNFNTNANFSWQLPLDFTWSSQLDYSYNGGYADDMKPSSTVWNMTVSKKFLKKKKGVLSFSVFDILNDRSNVSRTVSSTSITDSRYMSINRYCMLSFVYKFSIFKGKKATEDEYEDFY